ncbi:MAG: zinc ribbon domain-containing protein [Oscillospiraceae bacterium]|jgi:hypothetical protein|nr:zinc ribbon domain-containing protein [Oscillospiraceae bacterium]
MFCHKCGNNVADANFCTNCGTTIIKNDAIPINTVENQSSQHVQIPQNPNQTTQQQTYQALRKQNIIHPSVKGLAFVSLIGFLAWIVAVVSPILSISRIFNGLRNFYNDALNTTFSGMDDFFQNPTFDVDAIPELSEYLDFLLEFFQIARVSFSMIALGAILLFLVFIFLFIMTSLLRSNYKAAFTLMIINFCFCALSCVVNYSTISQIQDVIGILPSPYDNALFISALAIIVVSGLWLTAIVIYSTKIAKSNRIRK